MRSRYRAAAFRGHGTWRRLDQVPRARRCSRKESLSQIPSIDKADYEKSKTPSRKLAMAQRMVKEAEGTKDDAAPDCNSP